MEQEKELKTSGNGMTASEEDEWRAKVRKVKTTEELTELIRQLPETPPRLNADGTLFDSEAWIEKVSNATPLGLITLVRDCPEPEEHEEMMALALKIETMKDEEVMEFYQL